MTGSVRRLACLIALLFAGLYFHSSAADGALRQEGQCTPTGSLVPLPALPEASGLASSLRVPGVTADPLDPHSVVAELPQQRSNARLVTVQPALLIDVDLTLAARAAESVVVQGATDAPPVTTRMTIAGEALRQMPSRLPSRGVPQVLATLPGWASEDNGLLHVRGVDDGVLYVEDGVPVYDRMDALSGIAPDPESIGTINVLTGYIPPEYGLKSGAVIDFSTRCIPTTFTTKGPATPSAFPVRVVAALLVSPLVSHVAMYRRHIQADLRSTAADTPLFATSDRQHDRLGLLGSATYERNRHTAKAGFEIARLRLQEDFRFRRDVGSGGRARYPLWRAAHVPRRRCAWVCALVCSVRLLAGLTTVRVKADTTSKYSAWSD